MFTKSMCLRLLFYKALSMLCIPNTYDKCLQSVGIYVYYRMTSVAAGKCLPAGFYVSFAALGYYTLCLLIFSYLRSSLDWFLIGIAALYNMLSHCGLGFMVWPGFCEIFAALLLLHYGGLLLAEYSCFWLAIGFSAFAAFLCSACGLRLGQWSSGFIFRMDTWEIVA